jgi:hypothetical protein
MQMPMKLPTGKKAISTKWVIKIKTNIDISVHYKAGHIVRAFE